MTPRGPRQIRDEPEVIYTWCPMMRKYKKKYFNIAERTNKDMIPILLTMFSLYFKPGMKNQFFSHKSQCMRTTFCE